MILFTLCHIIVHAQIPRHPKTTSDDDSKNMNTGEKTGPFSSFKTKSKGIIKLQSFVPSEKLAFTNPIYSVQTIDSIPKSSSLYTQELKSYCTNDQEDFDTDYGRSTYISSSNPFHPFLKTNSAASLGIKPRSDGERKYYSSIQGIQSVTNKYLPKN